VQTGEKWISKNRRSRLCTLLQQSQSLSRDNGSSCQPGCPIDQHVRKQMFVDRERIRDSKNAHSISISMAEEITVSLGHVFEQ
jgi:hypothetical protein